MNWRLITVVATVGFLIIDFTFSTGALGFYDSKFEFNATEVRRQIFLTDGYNFLRAGFDFFLLTLFRSLIAVVGLVLCLRQEPGTPAWTLFFTGIELTNISFSFAKLLAFSEFSEQLAFVGVWFSLVWNALAFLGLLLLWQFGFRSKHCKQGAEWSRLLEDTEAQSNGDVVHNANIEEAESKESRLSTLNHVVRLLSYCKNHGRWFAVGFVFLIIYSLARVFIPKYTAEVISNIVHIKTMSELVHSVLIMSGLSLVVAITGGLRGGCFDYATALVSRRIRRDLFRSIMRQDIAFFDEMKTGEVMSRLTSDCQTMSTTISTNVNVFMRNGVMLLGSLAFMISISWRLTLITFIAVPVIGFITKAYGAYYDRLSESTQTTIAQANQVAEQAISSIRTVRSFACEMNECGRFEAKLAKTLTINGRKSLAYFGYTVNNEFCDSAILVAILFYGGHLVLSGKMDVNGLFAFLLYQLQLGENLYNLGYVFTGLMESVGASRKVFEYMFRTPKILNDGDTKLEAVQGLVKFDQITFSYPSRPTTTVLDNVTFEVKPGETVALVGPSGAGKSSIISLLEHFYEPKEGIISLDGVNVSDLDHKFFHQKVSLVAQEPVLYDGTVRYNILYGCEEWADDDDMIRAAKLANIHDFIMESEKGYDTECGEKGIQMSGGQKQRIAIARALVRRPAVLILDEATSALDAESEHIIQEALQKCSVGRTVIVIAHRLSTVEKADRIVVINKGQVLQQGNHKSLMQDTAGLYHSLVQRQLLQRAEEDEQKQESQ